MTTLNRAKVVLSRLLFEKLELAFPTRNTLHDRRN